MWHFIGAAMAQDPTLILPVVPSGASVVSTWYMNLVYSIATGLFGLAIWYVKQWIADQAISRAMSNGAMLAENTGGTHEEKIATAVNYVQTGHPGDLAWAQPTPEHLRNMAIAQLPPAGPPKPIGASSVGGSGSFGARTP